MELSKLIYKLADQLDNKNTQELFLDLAETNETKYETKTSELKLDIDIELQDLQAKLDSNIYTKEFESIYDTILVTLEHVYLNTNLNLSRLISNVTDPEIKEGLSNMITRKQMCSCD